MVPTEQTAAFESTHDSRKPWNPPVVTIVRSDSAETALKALKTLGALGQHHLS